jgi:hypothetical protein
MKTWPGIWPSGCDAAGHIGLSWLQLHPACKRAIHKIVLQLMPGIWWINHYSMITKDLALIAGAKVIGRFAYS